LKFSLSEKVVAPANLTTVVAITSTRTNMMTTVTIGTRTAPNPKETTLTDAHMIQQPSDITEAL